VWAIYTLQKATSRPASEILDIRHFSQRITGLSGDTWTAFQVDSAVTFFGQWVENRLAQTDDNGRPLYRLADLLWPKCANSPADWLHGAAGIRGAVGKRRAR
jgi:hypothetical protein